MHAGGSKYPAGSFLPGRLIAHHPRSHSDKHLVNLPWVSRYRVIKGNADHDYYVLKFNPAIDVEAKRLELQEAGIVSEPDAILYHHASAGPRSSDSSSSSGVSSSSSSSREMPRDGDKFNTGRRRNLQAAASPYVSPSATAAAAYMTNNPQLTDYFPDYIEFKPLMPQWVAMSATQGHKAYMQAKPTPSTLVCIIDSGVW